MKIDEIIIFDEESLSLDVSEYVQNINLISMFSDYIINENLEDKKVEKKNKKEIKEVKLMVNLIDGEDSIDCDKNPLFNEENIMLIKIANKTENEEDEKEEERD